MKILATVIIALAFVACKNTKQAANDKIQSIEVADGWEASESEGGDYVLHYQNIEDVSNPRLKKEFYILDAKGEKVFESSTYGGYVKWLDATKVEYFSPPGVMNPNDSKDDLIMIYDIEKKMSYSKSELSK